MAIQFALVSNLDISSRTRSLIKKAPWARARPGGLIAGGMAWGKAGYLPSGCSPVMVKTKCLPRSAHHLPLGHIDNLDGSILKP